jgi:hypothetical protein
MITTLDQKHISRSDKYKVVATKEIAQRFKELGFVVDEYMEARVRKVDRIGYQKHMVRLSNPNLKSIHEDIKLQLLVTNSHDGSTSFKMQLGFYRFVCSNGLIVGETFESVRLRHSGSILEEIEEAIERIVAQADLLNVRISMMKAKTLSPIESRTFIEEALKLRNIKEAEVPVLRPEDMGEDLFTVYNRVQEMLVTGGSDYRNQNNRVRQLRGIRNIAKLTKINEQLFDLAMRYVA